MATKKNSQENRVARVQEMAALTRYDLVAMLSYCGSGHPGGSLSIVEILSALYYGDIMKFDPANPTLPTRDRLIMSKGHASPTQYVVLADLGYFPKEWLRDFDANGSNLPKHCDRFKTPGVEVSTGPLGQGISIAVGFALTQRIDAIPYDIYCIIGDGECQSGNVYEAAMAAGAFKLGSLKVILDRNNLQIDGDVDDIMPLGDIAATWRSLGWDVRECDGHKVTELLDSLDAMKAASDKPQLLIANTTKGKGVSFMENNVDWHSDKISKDQAVVALSEVELCDCGGRCKASFLRPEELAKLCGK